MEKRLEGSAATLIAATASQVAVMDQQLQELSRERARLWEAIRQTAAKELGVDIPPQFRLNLNGDDVVVLYEEAKKEVKK
jgi:hypothetical protein